MVVYYATTAARRQNTAPAHHDHFTPSDANQLSFLMPFADDSLGVMPPQAQGHAKISLAQQDRKVFCGHGNAVPWQSVDSETFNR